MLDVDEAVIDGEVIAADETGRPMFYDLLSGRRRPAYVAFDIVWLNHGPKGPWNSIRSLQVGNDKLAR